VTRCGAEHETDRVPRPVRHLFLAHGKTGVDTGHNEIKRGQYLLRIIKGSIGQNITFHPAKNAKWRSGLALKRFIQAADFFLLGRDLPDGHAAGNGQRPAVVAGAVIGVSHVPGGSGHPFQGVCAVAVG
jgi:hypothetical protein